MARSVFLNFEGFPLPFPFFFFFFRLAGQAE